MGGKLVVVNLHGGFPSCFVEAAFEHLDAFKALAARNALVYTRAYATSGCAPAALHDVLMDAPLGSMTDAPWHPWAKVRHPARSLFHLLQQHKYRTWAFGAFGLDPSLDPHRNPRAYPVNTRKALQSLGIDEFDAEDAAFTCREAGAHDACVIERAARAIRGWKADERHACVLSLLACQDVHKCAWHDDAAHEARVPAVEPKEWMPPGLERADEASVAESVFRDDPRAPGYAGPEGLRRLAMLHDFLKGDAHELPGRERLVRRVAGLHKFAWATLQRLDAHLAPLIKELLEAPDATVVLTSDHALSLYEHGVVCEAPWDAACRTFLAVSTPATRAMPGSAPKVHPRVPLSLACLPTLVLQALKTSADWHVQAPPNGVCAAVSLAPSALCRANVEPRVDAFSLPCFWARFVVPLDDRVYAVVFWWSLDDLVASTIAADAEAEEARAAEGRRRPASHRRSDAPLAASVDEWFAMPRQDRAHRCAQREAWRLPLDDDKLSAAYDLTVDPGELHDLARKNEGDERTGAAWPQGSPGRAVLAAAREAARHHRFLGGDVCLRLPEAAHALAPDDVAHCSVQTRPLLLRRAAAATRDVAVQTEAAVHFAPLPAPGRRLPRARTPVPARPPTPSPAAPAAPAPAAPTPTPAAPTPATDAPPTVLAKKRSVASLESTRHARGRN